MKNELYESLANMSEFMKEIGEQPWASILLILAETVENDNIHCEQIRKLKRLFGGMGSLDDLSISIKKGHNISNENEADFKFNTLKSRLYAIIYKLSDEYGC